MALRQYRCTNPAFGGDYVLQKGAYSTLLLITRFYYACNQRKGLGNEMTRARMRQIPLALYLSLGKQRQEACTPTQVIFDSLL
jgi:hypothetical protein